MADVNTVTLASGDAYTVGSLTSAVEYGVTAGSGVAGPVGYTGSGGTGYTGSAGAGYTGSMGSQGPQGVQGAVGAQGSVGSQGAQGSIGSLGYTGSVGDLGYTGSIGSQGPQGVQGVQGTIGYAGSAGTAGGLGYTGSIGPQGAQGIAGSPGYTGSTGNISTITSDIIPDTNEAYDLGSVSNQWKNLWVANTATVARVQEPFIGLINANGVFVHDCSNTHLFTHSSLSGNFTANFTNLNLANNHATNLTLILNQGVTPYVANAVQIAGVSQTVNWQGNTAPPTGNASKKDIMSFSVINASGTFTVFGQLSSFG